ncbi:cytochrome c biogenesis CcdA family protein [Pelagibius sp. Alg239-R121]|uniref:cytochrome c biogenesis CcdA family protein n=1 Tax=Pelagibius sp. Alg239-R121 TaxID=2993448 RepID=UPI0024A63CFB|nr:cytochrome c biogenesis protein CcdA [Pelagibius sp. Alg239-R121]
MSFDVTFGGAFVAGLLSFLSPCVLPLVPPYICFISGVSYEELADGSGQGIAGRAARSALAFVLGFSVVFVALGASASAIGQLFASYVDVLSYLAGAVIIVMGLHFLGLFRIAFLYREARLHLERKPVGLIGAFVIGLTFAFGWTPCVGPVLAAILFIAGSEDTVVQGASLLSVYSLGIGVPFLLAALFASQFVQLMSRFRRHLGLVEKISGLLLVLTGVLIMTGSMNWIAYWLLETFPGLGSSG